LIKILWERVLVKRFFAKSTMENGSGNEVIGGYTCYRLQQLRRLKV
jgi:hypothetical protein